MPFYPFFQVSRNLHNHGRRLTIPAAGEGTVFFHDVANANAMKISQCIGVAFTLLALACQQEKGDGQQINTREETPTKLIERLVGEWELQGGGEGDANERIRFTEEARYIAYSGNQKVDSGGYRMNEQLQNLYLESEAGDQPREYEITMKQGVLTLTPRDGPPNGGAASYTYRRVSQPR